MQMKAIRVLLLLQTHLLGLHLHLGDLRARAAVLEAVPRVLTELSDLSTAELDCSREGLLLLGTALCPGGVRAVGL